MVTVIQFIEEISKKDLTLPPARVKQLRQRFGEKVFRMGYLHEDGTMLVPAGCVCQAARTLGTRTLAEAAEILRNGEILENEDGERLVDLVGDARTQRVSEIVRGLPVEPGHARHGWKRIETIAFSVDSQD
jgi:hypothetical protein